VGLSGSARLFANLGTGRVIIGTESPNGLHEVDYDADVLLRSTYSGDLNGAEEGVLSPDGSSLYLSSGRAIATADFSQFATFDGGVPRLSADASKLYVLRYDEELLLTYDSTDLTLLDDFPPSCQFMIGGWAITDVHPDGERLIIEGGSGLCLEQLDGSGVSPSMVVVRVTVPPFPNPGPHHVTSTRLAIFDADGQFIDEVSGGSNLYLSIRPGTYSFLVYGATDNLEWPLFSEWVGGSTTLTRDPPEAYEISMYEHEFDIELDPLFYDIPDTSRTYWDAIIWLQATGITQGCGTDQFCPNDYVTRGQMAAFLDRALDLPAAGPAGFIDDAGTFQQNIWNLKEAEITTGCAWNRYCPDDFVTRGQMAAFLDRALDLPAAGPAGFIDDAGTFQQNIWNLFAAGITTGCASDRYCTNDFVTRAQMALFLERALADDWMIG